MKVRSLFSGMVKTLLALGIVSLIVINGIAQPEKVEVTLDPACVRSIGDITSFDRNQFITVHESFGSTDIDLEDRAYMENELEVRYGRDGGLLSWRAPMVPADKNNPDMPDIEGIKAEAKKYRAEYDGPHMKPQDMKQVVLCTHPEMMHGFEGNTHAEWGPRTYEATAEYTAQFLKHAFSDEERPIYLEVFNEPFIKADKIPTTVEALSEQHNVVAKRVRELNPDVLVGGYSAAWADLESRNFQHWEVWQKKFMDIAGENMDFFSYHIYDGVNVKGTPSIRTGSNSEAIMDMIDTYSYISYGVAKPLLITEYGGIPRGNMKSMPYDAQRTGHMLYSFNGQLMTFMDHPDRLVKTVPYILGKALWTYGMVGDVGPDEANPFLLWRRLQDGTFVKTDLILFYQFWKGVEGDWRSSTASNPDVRVHHLIDDTRLTVALMNLDDDPKTVNLTGLEGLTANGVARRSLKTWGDLPSVDEEVLDTIPETVDLIPGEAVLLLIDLKETIAPESLVREHRVYATDYLQDIEEDEPVKFSFKKTPTGTGSAVLRLSSGRKKELEKLPSSVKFNGKELTIPVNWAGDDQAGRGNFFGMIEIPVPMGLVKESNQVKITYPDTGGKIACAVLQINRNEKL